MHKQRACAHLSDTSGPTLGTQLALGRSFFNFNLLSPLLDTCQMVAKGMCLLSGVECEFWEFRINPVQLPALEQHGHFPEVGWVHHPIDEVLHDMLPC